MPKAFMFIENQELVVNTAHLRSHNNDEPDSINMQSLWIVAQT